MTGGGDSRWPRAAVSVAVFRSGAVLLVERAKPPLVGIWSLPGGHIEPGETAAAAALRELAEETGISADLEGLVDVFDVIRHDASGMLTAHYVIACYYARWLSGEPVGATDASAAAFVTLDGLDRYRLTDGASGLIGRAHRLHLLA